MPNSSFHTEEILAHAAWVQTMVREMVADPSLADDLSQQTLEVGLRHDLSRVQNLRSWFRGVAKNLLRQSHRSQIRRERREQKVANPDGSAEPPLQELTERVEIQQKVASAVLELPQQHRRVLILRYYEQHSVSQIAEAFGISNSAAGLRIHRAKSMLRNRLQSKLGGDWRVLAYPISTKITGSATTVFAMHKFAKIAAISIIGLIVLISLQFPLTDSNNQTSSNSATESLSPLANFENPPEPVNARLAETESAIRQAQDSSFNLQIVDSHGNGIPEASIQLFEGCWEQTTENLNGFPMTLNGPMQPKVRAKADESGWIVLPFPNPEVNTAVFAIAPGYIPRGLILRDQNQEEFDSRRSWKLQLNGPSYSSRLRFIDEDGQPIQGLKVSGTSGLIDWERGFTAAAGTVVSQYQFTNETGIAHFQNLPGPEVSFSVQRQGYKPWHSRLVASETWNPPIQEFILDRGGGLLIEVCDESGTPVPGVDVYYTDRQWILDPYRVTPFLGGAIGKTGSDGSLLIQGLPDEAKHQIQLIKGRTWLRVKCSELGQPLKVTWPNSYTLQGTFQYPDQIPASHAKITIIDVENPFPTPNAVLELDENGFFEVDLPKGVFGYEVIHKNGIYQGSGPIQLLESVDLGRVQLAAAPLFNLSILDYETGEPIDNAIAKFPRKGQAEIGTQPESWREFLASSRGEHHGISFKGGAIRTSQIPAGVHHLQVEATGYSTEIVNFELKHGRELDLAIRLRPAAILDISINTAFGEPACYQSFVLAKASAKLFSHERYPSSADTFRIGRTDGEGKVTFENLPPGKWNLEPHAQALMGKMLQTFDLNPGRSQMEVRLPSTGELQFEVRSGDQEVEGATVHLYRRLAHPRAEYNPHALEAISDESGIARFEGLFFDQYRALVVQDGALPKEIHTRVDSQQKVIPVQFEGSRVSGSVTNPQENTWVVLIGPLKSISQPIETRNEAIRLQFSQSNSNRWPAAKTRDLQYAKTMADSFGRFEFSGIPAGEYIVFPWNSRNPIVAPEELFVLEKGISDLSLSLRPSPMLKVSISGLDAYRRVHEGAYIRGWVTGKNRRETRSILLSTEDGTYSQRDVFPSDREIVFELVLPASQSGPRGVAKVKKTITLQPGLTTEVSLKLEEFGMDGAWR